MSGAGRALVLGGVNGLLGRSLVKALTAAGWDADPTSRADLDPFDRTAVAARIASVRPDYVFNTIAYTAVDQAEDEPEAAYRLNRDLPNLLGETCGAAGVGFVHYGTDFVFDGAKNTPYVEDDPVNPQCVYGASKLAGETALLALDLDNLLILRTSWLFGPGKINFVEKILGFAKERESINVVNDQKGSPTYTPDLAEWSIALCRAGATGVFHTAGGGLATWCELAVEAVAAAGIDCRVLPVPSDAFPQKATRPPYSVLDTSKLAGVAGVTPRSWIQAVREYVYKDLGMTSDRP